MNFKQSLYHNKWSQLQEIINPIGLYQNNKNLISEPGFFLLILLWSSSTRLDQTILHLIQYSHCKKKKKQDKSSYASLHLIFLHGVLTWSNHLNGVSTIFSSNGAATPKDKFVDSLIYSCISTHLPHCLYLSELFVALASIFPIFTTGPSKNITIGHIVVRDNFTNFKLKTLGDQNCT